MISGSSAVIMNQIVAGVRLDRRADHAGLQGLDGLVDFRDDQALPVGAEVAAFRLCLVVDRIALRELAEIPAAVDLRLEIFGGGKIGQQHLRHAHFERRQQLAGVLLIVTVQLFFR